MSRWVPLANHHCLQPWNGAFCSIYQCLIVEKTWHVIVALAGTRGARWTSFTTTWEVVSWQGSGHLWVCVWWVHLYLLNKWRTSREAAGTRIAESLEVCFLCHNIHRVCTVHVLLTLILITVTACLIFIGLLFAQSQGGAKHIICASDSTSWDWKNKVQAQACVWQRWFPARTHSDGQYGIRPGCTATRNGASHLPAPTMRPYWWLGDNLATFNTQSFSYSLTNGHRGSAQSVRSIEGQERTPMRLLDGSSSGVWQSGKPLPVKSLQRPSSRPCNPNSCGGGTNLWCTLKVIAVESIRSTNSFVIELRV